MGVIYVWQSPVWKRQAMTSAGGGSGAGAAIVSDTPPPSPALGQLWYESDSGNTFLWYGDADSQQWVQVNASAAPMGVVGFTMWPAGIGIDWWGPNEAAGTRFCDGRALSRTAYAGLFAAIGTTFGAGDGSTTFLLPDCRGRSIAGKDNMGGSAAGRLTTLTALGASGGAETHVLTLAQLAAHTHSFSGTAASGGISANHSHTVAAGTHSSGSTYQPGSGWNVPDTTRTTSLVSSDHAHTTTIAGTSGGGGSDAAHNNLQPTIICNKLITTGGVP